MRDDHHTTMHLVNADDETKVMMVKQRNHSGHREMYIDTFVYSETKDNFCLFNSKDYV